MDGAASRQAAQALLRLMCWNDSASASDPDQLLVTTWPEKVQQHFDITRAARNDTLNNVLQAPYNKLLNTLSPVDTGFMVIPNFQEINSSYSTNSATSYLPGKSACLCAGAHAREGFLREVQTHGCRLSPAWTHGWRRSHWYRLAPSLSVSPINCLSSTGLAQCQCRP